MDASNNEFWSSIPTLDDLLLLDSDLVSWHIVLIPNNLHLQNL
jgi:hypothetical protein